MPHNAPETRHMVYMHCHDRIMWGAVDIHHPDRAPYEPFAPAVPMIVPSSHPAGKLVHPPGRVSRRQPVPRKRTRQIVYGTP